MTIRSLTISLTVLGLVASSVSTAYASRVRPQTSAVCAATPLGPAQNYNGFFLGDVKGTGSGTGGMLAVGGDAAFSDYSVGTALSGSGNQNVLIVGGALQFNRGSVNGNVVYGQSSSLTNTSLSGGTAAQGSPIDFAAAAKSLTALTASLSHLKRNGTTSGRYGTIVLRGANPTRDVFHVSSARLAAAHLVRIQTPKGATAIVIVNGQTTSIKNLGVSLHGVKSTAVLTVFPSARTLTIGGVGLQMSILAPRAAVTFNDGAIAGTLIGSTLTGTGHLMPAAFGGCLPRS